MTMDKLSPDEISGLLGQGGTKETASTNSSLSKQEIEVLTELLTVSFGSSSAALSQLFNEQVTVMNPMLSVIQKNELLTSTTSPLFIVLGEYTGGLNGLQILTINKTDVLNMIHLMNHTSDLEEKESHLQAVQTVVEQMFTAVSQSMTTVLDQEVSYSLTGLDEVENQEDFEVAKFSKADWFVHTNFQLKLGSQQSVNFNLSMPIEIVKKMIQVLGDTMDEDYSKETHEMKFQSNDQSNSINRTNDSDQTPNIQSVQFSSFDEAAATRSEPSNLDMLLDIPLQVTVELGRTKRMVKEILEISQGSIIELDKLAGEPVDILINNKLIAVGEVVVIDENFGVRVTDILSTAERISKLR